MVKHRKELKLELQPRTRGHQTGDFPTPPSIMVYFSLQSPNLRTLPHILQIKMELSRTPSHDAVATLQYLKWQDLYLVEKPYQVFCPLANESASRSNLVFEDGPEETIRDARGLEGQFDLDQHGFVYGTIGIDSTVFQNEDSIEARYLPRVREFIYQKLGDAKEIYFFDWQVSLVHSYQFYCGAALKPTDSANLDCWNGCNQREGQDNTSSSLEACPPRYALRRPVRIDLTFHKDQHPTVIPQVVRGHLGDRAERLLQGRVRVIK